jgi:hypothetical protein
MAHAAGTGSMQPVFAIDALLRPSGGGGSHLPNCGGSGLPNLDTRARRAGTTSALLRRTATIGQHRHDGGS